MPASVNRIPMAEEITSFNHVKSTMTAALMGIPQCNQDLPLILRYISDRAGRPQGSTFSIQFKCPAKRCHMRRDGERPGVVRKRSIFVIRSDTVDGGKEILPALISTQKPIILRASPCSCLRSLNGQEIDSQRSKNCTCRHGRSFPWYHTKLSA
jgi:hypothetical protein